MQIHDRFFRFTLPVTLPGLSAATILLLAGILAAGCEFDRPDDGSVHLATFAVDATPPIGSPMAYDPVEAIDMPLSARGVVLVGNEEPIVLMALDWIGVYNEPYDSWRQTLAEAAGTTPERVTIHSLHQHDAPRADFTVGSILADYGILQSSSYDNREFVEQTIERTAEAVRRAVERELQTITHVGTGTGMVEKVASNRRILNREGHVRQVRYSSGATNPVNRQAPAGTIDPEVKLLSFWNEDEPVAALSYYATHPQSYYLTGAANPDFPGISRLAREEATGIRHIHFTGAAGNIAAGKWNDGATEMRQILADRLAEGMARAWDNTERTRIHPGQLEWRVEPVVLPPRENLDVQELRDILADEEAENRVRTARELAFLSRNLDGYEYEVTSLRAGPARVLHTPAELAIQYQLEAQAMWPGDFIANASYSNSSPGYISTKIQYHQEGGYESSDRASRVAPGVEPVLRSAIRKALDFEAFRPDPGELSSLGYRLSRTAIERGSDSEWSWAQSSAGVMPAGVLPNPVGKPTVVLATQKYDPTGQDRLQGLHTFQSRDLGFTWEGPYEEPAFSNAASGNEQNPVRAVSNFTPAFHSASGTLLGIGHTVLNKTDRKASAGEGDIVYTAFDPQTRKWQQRQTLQLPGDLHNASTGAGFIQRVDLDNGTILLPVQVNDQQTGSYHTTVIRCSFDGETLEYLEHGSELTLEAASGFRDPLLTEFNGTWYLSLRSDQEVYVARSGDGLGFEEPESLTFDNGQSFGSHYTPQGWVAHSNALYLAYSRRNGDQNTLFRHRAPLLLAKVDPVTLQVIADSEQPIIPVRSGRIDNISVTNISEEETWVITTNRVYPQQVGDWQNAKDNSIIIARLQWIEGNAGVD